MDALPYYKWHWQDWRANRRVQRMPWQAKGPYRELLDELWAEGSLPADLPSLADIVGCTEAELTDLWPHISPCFQERNGRLYNAKMDAQRTSTDAARVAMATGGQAGGRASNSATRAKAKQAKPKPTLSVPEAMPDIEEKTREEKKRKESSRGKRESVSHPFFEPVKDLIFRYYRNRNHIDPEWNGREGKGLSELLKANPDAPMTHWKACIVGRNNSDVNHAERPGVWLANLSSYRNAVNAFNRPKPVAAESKPNTYAGSSAVMLAKMAAAEQEARDA